MFEANDQLMWPSKTVSSILFLHYRSSVLSAKENLAQKLFVLTSNSLYNRKLKSKDKVKLRNFFKLLLVLWLGGCLAMRRS